MRCGHGSSLLCRPRAWLSRLLTAFLILYTSVGMAYDTIRRCMKSLKFSSHAKEEMISEELGVIREAEVKEALQGGEIIEEYPDDKPYPSFLVYGKTRADRPLHVVCAPVIEEGILIIHKSFTRTG